MGKSILKIFGVAALMALGAGAVQAEDVAKIGEKGYATLNAAFADAKDGDVITLQQDVTASGSYAVKDGVKNITVAGVAKNVKFVVPKYENPGYEGNAIYGLNGVNITFKDMTLEWANQSYNGFKNVASETYVNCSIHGGMWTYQPAKFTGCDFHQTSGEHYNVWNYGESPVSYDTCTFENAGKGVHVYREGGEARYVYATGCSFESNPEGKGAFNIKNGGVGGATDPVAMTIIISDCTTTSSKGLFQTSNGDAAANTVLAVGTGIKVDESGKITEGNFTILNRGASVATPFAEGVTVKENGDGTYTASSESAARTIDVTNTAEAQAALDAAKEGDTIVLAAGTYDKLFLRQTKENSTRESSLDNGGSYPAYYREFKGVTIKAADDAAVTVKGITAEAGLFWHSSAPASNQADMNATAGFHSYLDIENLAIKGITFDVSENSGVVLRDNVISGHEGLYADGLTIDGCSTVNGDETNTGIHFLTAGAGTTDNAFFTTEKKGINNVTVSNCTISNVFQPISFNNSTALLNNLTVTGNTFTDCGYSNILMLSNKANTGTFTVTGNTVNRIVARFIRSTHASADWTITGNTLANPLQYEEESGTDIVKITDVPATATITSTDNSWGEGALVNGTWIANGDKAALVAVAEILDGKVHHVYPTLQAAINAAKDGAVITLLSGFSTDEAISVSGKVVEIRTEDYATAAAPTIGLRTNYVDQNKIAAQAICYFRKPGSNPAVEIDRMLVGDFEKAVARLTEINKTESPRCVIGLHGDVTLQNDLVLPPNNNKGTTSSINIKANCTFDLNGHSVTQTPGTGWSNVCVFDVTCAYAIPALDKMEFTLKDSQKTGAIYTPLHVMHVDPNTTVNIQDVKMVYGVACTAADVAQDTSSGGQAVVVIENYGEVNLSDSTIVCDKNTVLTGEFPWSLLPYAGVISVESGYYEGLMWEGDGFGDLNITGGTYASDYVCWFKADGYVAVNVGESLWKVVPMKDAVASITYGEGTSDEYTDYFLTLDDAVAAVPTDGTETTITIIADHTIAMGDAETGMRIEKGQKIVLDLNGKKIVGTATRSGTSQLIDNYGTLTVTDTAEKIDGKFVGSLVHGANPAWVYDGSGSYSGSYASNLIRNYGEVIINGGHLENASVAGQTGGAAYVVDNSSNAVNAPAKLTINDGELVAAWTAVRSFANDSTYSADIVVNGGSITAVRNAILVNSASGNSHCPATLKISGGTLTSTRANGGSGGVIQIWNGFKDGANTRIDCDITGGMFSGGEALFEFDGAAEIQNNAVLCVSGGVFNREVAATVIADGYACVANTDAATKEAYPWTIGEKAAEVAAVISADGTTTNGYATLQAAFDAAGNGETVVLLVDVTSAMNEAFSVAKGKSITFDLNGKVLSGGNDKETGFAYLTNNGTLTLKDSSAEGTGKITSKTYPDTGDCAGFHTVLNKGTFVMESGTIEEASEKVGYGVNLKWAFRNEASANQTVVATIRGGTIVANYNAVSDYVYDDTADCTLNIEGGVIKSTGRFSAVTLQDAGSSKPKLHVNVSGGEFIVENKINTNADGNAIFYCDDQTNAGADFTGCFKITGGKFNTFKKELIVDYDTMSPSSPAPTHDTGYMTAGLSKCVIPQESIADGYACVANTDAATKDAYPWKVQEPTVTVKDDAQIVIDINPEAHEEQGEKVPVVVTQELANEILNEILGETADVTQPLEAAQVEAIVTQLETKGEDGMTGWQKYAAGFKQTDRHPLAPKGKGAEDGKLVLVTSLVAPKQLSLDTGVKVKYILKKATTVNPATGVPDDAAFEKVQELDSPEFPVDVTELPPETYWKIDVEYTATKTVEVKVEDVNK